MVFTPITLKNFFFGTILSLIVGFISAILSDYESIKLKDFIILYGYDMLIVIGGILTSKLFKKMLMPVEVYKGVVTIAAFVAILYNSIKFIPMEIGIDFFFGFIIVWASVYMFTMEVVEEK